MIKYHNCHNCHKMIKCHNCPNFKSSLHTTGVKSAWKGNSLSLQNDSSLVNFQGQRASDVEFNSVVLPKTANCRLQKAKPCFDGQVSIETWIYLQNIQICKPWSNSTDHFDFRSMWSKLSNTTHECICGHVFTYLSMFWWDEFLILSSNHWILNVNSLHLFLYP